MNRKLTLSDRQHIASIGSTVEEILDTHIYLDDYIRYEIEDMSHYAFADSEGTRIMRKLRKKKWTADEIEGAALGVVYEIYADLNPSDQVILEERGVI
jgi:hypothetical protein